MIFDINDFKVVTEKKIEYLEEQIIAPTTIRNDKPYGYDLKNKTRDFMIFSGLNALHKEDGKYYRVISDMFDFIDLVEVLKAFAGNKLNIEKEYNFNDKFNAKILQKKSKHYLQVHFKNYSNNFYFDKFEAVAQAAKFQKILSKCEAYQEHDEWQE